MQGTIVLGDANGDGIVSQGELNVVLTNYWENSPWVTLTNAVMQHAIDHTPYEGREVTGWPVLTMRRGAVVMRDGVVSAAPGSGRYLPCPPYEFIAPSGRLPNGFDASAFA